MVSCSGINNPIQCIKLTIQSIVGDLSITNKTRYSLSLLECEQLTQVRSRRTCSSINTHLATFLPHCRGLPALGPGIRIAHKLKTTALRMALLLAMTTERVRPATRGFMTYFLAQRTHWPGRTSSPTTVSPCPCSYSEPNCLRWFRLDFLLRRTRTFLLCNQLVCSIKTRKRVL